MKTKNVKWGLCLVLILACTVIYAQSDQGSPKSDEDIVSSIASYPSDVRSAILNVSQYPRKIVKLERVQGRTSQSFQDLISDYSRDDQKKFYELCRYPDLVHQLVEESPQSLGDIKPSISTYPKEVAEAANALYPKRWSDLRSMDKLYQSSQKNLAKVTEDLPNDTQADFKKVVSKPDVMYLLTEHIDQVVKLGESYKEDPKAMKAKLDDLSAQISAQNQKDLADYKNTVASDPKMQEEMKKSAQDFANNNDQKQPTVVNNYYGYGGYYGGYGYPYPYWFGYPYWYDYAMWYPMPYYYYTGFYYGLGGRVVVIGMPSPVYRSWMFSFGYNRYPRYYGYYGGYYSNHRTLVTNLNVYRNINTTVNNNFSRIRNTNVNSDANVYRGGRQRNSVLNGTQTFHSRSNTTPGQFRNSFNQQNNFNRGSFDNFRSNQLRQQNGGTFRNNSFDHGMRMGGGFGGGGGGHFGGGHGRR